MKRRTVQQDRQRRIAASAAVVAPAQASQPKRRAKSRRK